MMGSKDTLEVSKKPSDIEKWNCLREEKGGLQPNISVQILHTVLFTFQWFWKGEFVWQSGAS